jgi:hypothetical protein
MRTQNIIKPRLIWHDHRGAIEGLPLYLIILVVITVVAVSIILAWLFIFTDNLGAVSVTPDEISLEDKTDDGEYAYNSDVTNGIGAGIVTITVKSDKGRPLKGAVIHLSGCGIDERHKTDASGKWSSEGKGLDVKLPMAISSGEIIIKVTYHAAMGMQMKTVTIMVNNNVE